MVVDEIEKSIEIPKTCQQAQNGEQEICIIK